MSVQQVAGRAAGMEIEECCDVGAFGGDGPLRIDCADVTRNHCARDLVGAAAGGQQLGDELLNVGEAEMLSVLQCDERPRSAQPDQKGGCYSRAASADRDSHRGCGDRQRRLPLGVARAARRLRCRRSLPLRACSSRWSPDRPRTVSSVLRSSDSTANRRANRLRCPQALLEARQPKSRLEIQRDRAILHVIGCRPEFVEQFCGFCAGCLVPPGGSDADTLREPVQRRVAVRSRARLATRGSGGRRRRPRCVPESIRPSTPIRNATRASTVNSSRKERLPLLKGLGIAGSEQAAARLRDEQPHRRCRDGHRRILRWIGQRQLPARA